MKDLHRVELNQLVKYLVRGYFVQSNDTHTLRNPTAAAVYLTNKMFVKEFFGTDVYPHMPILRPRDRVFGSQMVVVVNVVEVVAR